MEGRPEYHYLSIRPTRSIAGAVNPTGSLDFEVTVQGSDLIDIASSFINLRARLTKAAVWILAGDTTGNGGVFAAENAAVGGFQTLAQNPLGCLISNASLYVNDVLVSRSDQFGVASTCMRLAWDSRAELEESGSPIVPYEFAPANYATSGATTPERTLTQIVNGTTHVVRNTAGDAIFLTIANPQALSAIKRLRGVCPDIGTEVTVTAQAYIDVEFSLPITAALFHLVNRGETLPNSRLRLSLTLEPAGAGTLTYTHNTADSELPITGITWTDVTWQLPCFKAPAGIPASLRYSARFLEGESTSRSFANSNSIQWTLASAGAVAVLVSFSPSNKASGLVDPHQFNGPFHDWTGVPGLNSLYIQYGGKSYPNPLYAFAAKEDRRRAYDDFRSITGALVSGSGSSMTFREWLSSPIFAFQVEAMPGENAIANVLQILSSSAAAFAAASNINVTTLYPRQLEIAYDEGGRPASTSVSNIV